MHWSLRPPDTLEARTNDTASDDLPERLAVEMTARTSFRSAYALMKDSSSLVRGGQEYATSALDAYVGDRISSREQDCKQEVSGLARRERRN